MPWLIPTLLYVLFVGVFGITAKLAMRTHSWQDLILWTGVGYAIAISALLLLGDMQLRLSEGTGWAALTGAIAVCALITLYVALGGGPASTVTAVSASYPVVTLVFAALFLAEDLSGARVAGVGLV